MSEDKTKNKEIQIAFPEHLKSGVYCNNMVVSHTKEEFIMDFMQISPPASTVTARVIMSPGHMKRTLAALKSNLEIYEQKIEVIPEASKPSAKGSVGFHKA